MYNHSFSLMVAYSSIESQKRLSEPAGELAWFPLETVMGNMFIVAYDTRAQLEGVGDSVTAAWYVEECYFKRH